jgi:hypothetical protein
MVALAAVIEVRNERRQDGFETETCGAGSRAPKDTSFATSLRLPQTSATSAFLEGIGARTGGDVKESKKEASQRTSNQSRRRITTKSPSCSFDQRTSRRHAYYPTCGREDSLSFSDGGRLKRAWGRSFYIDTDSSSRQPLLLLLQALFAGDLRTGRYCQRNKKLLLWFRKGAASFRANSWQQVRHSKPARIEYPVHYCHLPNRAPRSVQEAALKRFGVDSSRAPLLRQRRWTTTPLHLPGRRPR